MSERGAWGRFEPDDRVFDVERALARFRRMCRFEPETGCVVWTGGMSSGRGHHVKYGVFKFARKRWFTHRWAAKFIHGQDIDGFDVDHCCEVPTKPNTLCVEHLQSLTPARNRELQTQRKFIHLQVGLLRYEDIYGPAATPDEHLVPFYNPPAWLGLKEPEHERDDCPF